MNLAPSSAAVAAQVVAAQVGEGIEGGTTAWWCFLDWMKEKIWCRLADWGPGA